jgi:hypothetical protein
VAVGGSVYNRVKILKNFPAVFFQLSFNGGINLAQNPQLFTFDIVNPAQFRAGRSAVYLILLPVIGG